MPDMLASGLAWLTGQLKANASTPVTYRRGPNSVVVMAVFGNKPMQIDDGFGGIRLEWTNLDLCIPAADLFFVYGDLITPQRGDLIDITYGYDDQTFEVFPWGNEPPWRWADPHQSMIRVHTKWVNDATIGM